MLIYSVLTSFQENYNFLYRLLTAMGFTFEETEELRKLWESERECPHEIDSFASLPSSSNEYLSSDSLYLKHLLSKPLAYALRDVITRKPFDPVEYLGHWLLNYKVKYFETQKLRNSKIRNKCISGKVY